MSTSLSTTPRFLLGQIVATPGALAALDESGTNGMSLLARHWSCDWGDIPAEDWTANQEALTQGFRLFSNYPLTNGERIWIITEADRSVTTLLLPVEY